MKPKIRHEEILNLLHTQERVEVDELALRFDVSAETIRRDLAVLSEKGLLRKIHGGATRFQTAQEPSFGVRSILKSTEKRWLAQCASELINVGDSLFIASGTTTAAFAHALTRLSQLTVMILDRFPRARERVVLLNEFSHQRRGLDVEDPIGMSQDVYRACRDEMNAAMPDLVLHLHELLAEKRGSKQ